MIKAEISISFDPSFDSDFFRYFTEVNKMKDVSVHLDIMRGCEIGCKTPCGWAGRIKNDRCSKEQYETVLKHSNKKIDVHFMTSEKYIRGVIDKFHGVRSISFHIEAVKNPIEFIDFIKSYKIAVGVAVDLETDITAIDKTIFEKCDVVTIMSIRAGASGQKFDISAADKTNYIRKIAPDLRIIVDGGINPQTMGLIDADTYVTGSFMYGVFTKNGDMDVTVRELLDKIN